MREECVGSMGSGMTDVGDVAADTGVENVWQDDEAEEEGVQAIGGLGSSRGTSCCRC